MTTSTEAIEVLRDLREAFASAWSYFDDSSVTEIMLNPDGYLWVRRAGAGANRRTDHRMHPLDAETIFQLLAAHEDVDCGRQSPELSTELPVNGARFHGWLPPLVPAPVFSIRKRAERVYTLGDYVDQGALTSPQMRYLRRQVHARKNILIAGATNSGKTTFANALLHETKGRGERIVVIEDTRELQCPVDDRIELKTTPDYTARHALHGALRMNPDRVLLGEVRDGSALDLLKAWNTGHPGGFCTLHANSAADSLLRLEQLLLEAPNITRIPHRLIGQAIDVLLFMQSTPDGRRVEELLEVHGHCGSDYTLAPALSA
jgi:type IV secretion system protein VirB11